MKEIVLKSIKNAYDKTKRFFGNAYEKTKTICLKAFGKTKAFFLKTFKKVNTCCKKAAGPVCVFIKKSRRLFRSLWEKIAAFVCKLLRKKTLSSEEEKAQNKDVAENGEKKPCKVRKKHLAVSLVLGVICLFVLFLVFTKTGRELAKNAASRIAAKIAFSKVNEPTPGQSGENRDFEYIPDPKFDYDLGLEDGELAKVTILPLPTPEKKEIPDTKETYTPTPTPTPTISPVPVDPNIVNVLLIGEENLNDGNHGRSDAVLIATYNKKNSSVKLTSLMRDLYVWVPDSKGGEPTEQKLNTAYAWGGAKLLMKTVELNFGITCDSYVIVDFDGFVKVIDTLGGVDIPLSAEEAEYLRKTNYISDRSRDEMVEGMNHMSGVQALGFCRIRGENLLSADGKRYDFGRTSRQRMVLNAVFEKFKSSNYLTLYRLMMECLSYVSAPANLEKTASECLSIAIGNNLSSITMETERIPVMGHYSAAYIPIGVDAATGKILTMEVLTYDQENLEVLRKFIYGY